MESSSESSETTKREWNLIEKGWKFLDEILDYLNLTNYEQLIQKQNEISQTSYQFLIRIGKNYLEGVIQNIIIYFNSFGKMKKNGN